MAVDTTVLEAPRRNPWAVPLRIFRTPIGFQLSLAVIVIAGFLTAFASVLPLDDVFRQDLRGKLQEPAIIGGSADHLFGTDNLGRDLFSRTVFGLQRSFKLALVAVIAGGVVGVLLGVFAGYIGGIVDDITQRLIDVQLAIPHILLALALITTLGTDDKNLIIVLAVTTWVPYAKIARAETLPLKKREFVDLARVAGASHLRVMFRHILPHTLPSAFVVATLQVPLVMLFEAALSFLGVGVQPPDPSIGNIVFEGRAYIQSEWWFALIPSAVLVLVIMAMSIVGDFVRDTLDPNVNV
jgi:peptide/nickel transport system permease protein